jgi:hypothetical protein
MIHLILITIPVNNNGNWKGQNKYAQKCTEAANDLKKKRFFVNILEILSEETILYMKRRFPLGQNE